MLQRNKTRRPTKVGGRFAIVASEYNRRYVDAMVRAARRELRRVGVRSIKVARVPGAFEIPAVAAKLAGAPTPGYSAIICLGVIFRGETTHAEHIGNAVSLALAQIQVERKMPVIHGVYLFENEEQARVRCLSTRHGRGIETARTAIAMAQVMARL